MIVVINPSGSAGCSFKGLHAYCAHDPDRADTSERVEWMDMRNIAANDPEQAWKVMAATAGAQNELKRAAGIRAGRASKDGAVMHVVMSFDQNEPTDRDSMQTAADDFLSNLGADPAKMRGKAKPKRRQFADEHQVVMYAHRDTDHAHLHLMINTVHPEHGVKLPSNNNQLKAQKWALEHSKQQGTDQNYPAREENADMRAQGEYVKGQRRKSRNIYELEQRLAEAAKKNDQIKAALEQQRKKDAQLAQRGRNQAAMQMRARDALVEGHNLRKAALARQLQTETNKAKAEVRETFRPEWRELRSHQESERQTFEALETSFFGRASNMAKTIRLSADDVSEGRTNTINRAFQIITNATERQAYFDAAQERARAALQRQQAEQASEAAKALKASHEAKLADNRAVFEAKRVELAEVQKAEQAQLKQAWQERTAERTAAMEKLAAQAEASKKAQVRRQHDDGYNAELEADYAAQVAFDKAAQQRAADRGDGHDRDGTVT